MTPRSLTIVKCILILVSLAIPLPAVAGELKITTWEPELVDDSAGWGPSAARRT